MMSPISSRQYASPLLFNIKFSIIYQSIVIICALMIVLSVLFIDNMSVLPRMFLLLILLVLVVYSVKNNTTRQLQWQDDGSWLIRRNNQSIKAVLLSGSVVTSFFSALNFKLENNKNLNVIIFKDSIDHEKFRQLRVRMKVEGIRP